MERQIVPVEQIPVGTLLSRPKLGKLVTHFGIYYGNGQVFENTITAGSRIVSFAEFAQREEVGIVSWPVLADWNLYRRIHAEIAANRPYDFLLNNCEHVVNRVLFGTATSSQAQGAGALAMIALVLVAL